MIEVVREVVADVMVRSTSKLVVAKQNDVGSRFLNVRIKDSGKSLDIPGTSMVILNVQRPDNSAGTFYGSVNEGGTVRVELNSWILEQAGTIACDISILTENSAKLTTMTFYVEVEPAVCGDTDIEELEEYSVIVDLLSRTAAAENLAASAAADAQYVKEQCEEATFESRQATEECEAATARANEAAAQGFTHVEDKENPHGVTAEQLGLGNVDNTSDLDKPVSTAQAVAMETISQKAENAVEIAENAASAVADVVAISHYWEGTTLVVSSNSGTSS